MFNHEEIEEIKEYLDNVEPDSKIYLGCDSIKYKKHKTWYARYTTVMVVHMGGCHGSRIFGYTERERDYDPNKAKPRMRLMNEAYKVCGLYLAMAEELENFECEIHLDINPDERFNSHVALSQAVGYIRGMCGLDPIVKPDAFAAQYAADRFVRVKNYDITKPEPIMDCNHRRRKFAKRKAA